MSRRSVLKIGAGIGAAAFLDRRRVLAALQADLITKPIPTSGERIPVIGLGSASTFNVDPSAPDSAGPLEVVRLFHELGGTVIDTAPSYGRAEPFVGHAVGAIDAADDLFLATKVNVEDGGVEAALEQMEESSEVLGKRTVDLMQVWNLGDNFRSLSDRYLDAHLEAVRAWKERGRARYIGITTSFPRQYDLVEAALRRHELDFVQIDYSIGDRVPEETILPLARERGVAVLVNQPFTTGRLFSRVAGRELPTWTADFDCESWAQFFLKFVV
ncbi:MAG TPA: aldo/keto reductase, partial [Longimicrobiales bacterium]|nr:aldo/keto reductase [Longimicrobiales bacterium]